MCHRATLPTATTPFCRFLPPLFICFYCKATKGASCAMHEDRTERSLARLRRGGSVAGLQGKEPVVGNVGQGRIWPRPRAGRTPSSHLDCSLLLMVRNLGTYCKDGAEQPRTLSQWVAWTVSTRADRAGDVGGTLFKDDCLAIPGPCQMGGGRRGRHQEAIC